MEFWGVEVKAGSPLKVTPKSGKLIHISQAALGEGKNEKGSGIIRLHINTNDNKFVIGSLSMEKFPQVSFDLILEKEFELSHDWKNGSVYFCGYMTDKYVQADEDDFDSEDDEEDLPSGIAENGRVEPQAEEVKPATNKGKVVKPESSAKPKGTVGEPKKEKPGSDDDSEDDSDYSEDNEDTMGPESDDTSGSEDEDDSDEEDDSDDSDEETPKKPAGKKRPNESASRTPLPAKKNKLGSAQKTDGKKGGHVDTPHPSKKAEKTPALNMRTPKPDAKISCSSCPKKFASDSALQSHTKAKHTAK